jgi:RHS repeat-associated protein
MDIKFTGKERDAETGLDYFGARYYSGAQGRFTSPDPLGGHLADPQTLNRYAYVRNNPLRFNDPTGLDFYLKGGDACNTDDGPSCDKKGYVLNDDGKRVLVGNSQLRDANSGVSATFDSGGVHITTSQGTFVGQFASGTDATRVEGAGDFSGMHAVFNSDCGHTCAAGGSLFGTQAQFESLTKSGGLLGPNPGIDAIDPFHPGTTQFRGGNTEGPDAHLSYSPSDNPYQQDPFHFDNRYPYGSIAGFAEHTGGIFRTLWNAITFQPAAVKPQDIPIASVPQGKE